MPARKTLEWCQELAFKKNGKCLSVKYGGTKARMEWECSEGHKWWATIDGIQQGTWCPECAGVVPKTLEYCQNLARLKNGKCISTGYKNAHTKMEWECQEGHRWEAVANSIRHGHWCPYCGGSFLKSLEYCQELAKLKNGKCVSTKYKNANTKMEWECQDGHRWEAVANSVRQGHWCLICSGKAPKTLEDCQNLARLKNGKCASAVYVNSKTKMGWECQEGHRWEAAAGDIQQGKWCPECAGVAPKTLEYYQNLARLKNGKCISTQYRGMATRVEWECEKGHSWKTTASSVQQGTWCPHCIPKYSKAEKELFEFIKERYPDTQPNKKGLLKSKGLELDIYIPSLKVGIEYDGGYWHNQEGSKDRDFRKNQQCLEAGIELIRVPEEEYLRNPQEAQHNLLNQLADPNPNL